MPDLDPGTVFGGKVIEAIVELNMPKSWKAGPITEAGIRSEVMGWLQDIIDNMPQRQRMFLALAAMDEEEMIEQAAKRRYEEIRGAEGMRDHWLAWDDASDSMQQTYRKVVRQWAIAIGLVNKYKQT